MTRLTVTFLCDALGHRNLARVDKRAPLVTRLTVSFVCVTYSSCSRVSAINTVQLPHLIVCLLVLFHFFPFKSSYSSISCATLAIPTMASAVDMVSLVHERIRQESGHAPLSRHLVLVGFQFAVELHKTLPSTSHTRDRRGLGSSTVPSNEKDAQALCAALVDGLTLTLTEMEKDDCIGRIHVAYATESNDGVSLILESFTPSPVAVATK